MELQIAMHVLTFCAPMMMLQEHIQEGQGCC